MSADQPDLFANIAPPEPTKMEVPEEFVEGIRQELLATLARLEGTAVFVRDDLLPALVGERRFWSLLNWLPPDEGAALRVRFDAEMDRVCAPFMID